MSAHVLPVNDIAEHIEESTCPCCPSFELFEGELKYLHNSYDGREILNLAAAESCDDKQLAYLVEWVDYQRRMLFDNKVSPMYFITKLAMHLGPIAAQVSEEASLQESGI